MAITLTKKTTAPKKKEAITAKDLVDQYEAVWKELGKFAPQLKKIADKMKPLKEREKELMAQIEATEADRGPDDTFEVEGTNIAIEFGKQGSERTITDIRFIQKKMGNDTFYKLVKINLGDVDKYLTQPERDQCLETKRTARSFKVRQK